MRQPPPLRVWLAVAAGGGVGTQLRYWLLWLAPDEPDLPLTTLTVNVVGTSLLAVLTGYWSRRQAPAWLRAGVSVGLLGSFTTFSAFALVLERQLSAQQLGTAGLYALLSLALGAGAAAGGLWVGSRLPRRIVQASRDGV